MWKYLNKLLLLIEPIHFTFPNNNFNVVVCVIVFGSLELLFKMDRLRRPHSTCSLFTRPGYDDDLGKYVSPLPSTF